MAGVDEVRIDGHREPALPLCHIFILLLFTWYAHPTEVLPANLQLELLDRHNWSVVCRARRRVFEWIECFHNPQRRANQLDIPLEEAVARYPVRLPSMRRRSVRL